jgi:hypothetical protein
MKCEVFEHSESEMSISACAPRIIGCLNDYNRSQYESYFADDEDLVGYEKWMADCSANTEDAHQHCSYHNLLKPIHLQAPLPCVSLLLTSSLR